MNHCDKISKLEKQYVVTRLSCCRVYLLFYNHSNHFKTLFAFPVSETKQMQEKEKKKVR